MDKPVTLITGTSKGIGKALKEHYQKQGHIVLGCSRTYVDNEESYTHYTLDVTNENEVLHMFKDIKKQFNRLDNLINNIGAKSTNLAILTPLDDIRKVFQTNYETVFLCCREAAKLMKKNQYGRIVNFSSILVPIGQTGESAYVSSKSAVESLSIILSKEFLPYGITVNVIGPTLTETDMIADLTDEQKENLLQKTTLKKYSTYADIFNVVDFYLKKESAFITGQRLYLGGIV